ncbi:MAG: hypothetical protein IJO68_01655 [Clostridia bacterium]|nr:hypothetical protein [Clostridia bacterium]MBQ9945214.1 hypothetical protein [Clostridia bacterium]
MYKSILLAFVVLFFVIGVITVLSVFLIKAVMPDKKKKIFAVTVFDGDDKDCAVNISCVLSVLSVLGLMSRCEIIAVDREMTEKERELLYSAFQREQKVHICKDCDLCEKISDKLH